MPRAGTYDYPLYDIESVLDKLRTVHSQLRVDSMDRVVVADILNMAPRGGGFANIVSSLDKYGFVGTGRGNITITELGKLALYGMPEEQEQAFRQALANVKVYQDIYQLYGSTPSEDQIRAFLRQKAQVDVMKVQKISNTIYRNYNKMSRYLRIVEQPVQVDANQQAGIDRSEVPIPQDATAQPLVIKHGQVYIQLPPDDLESIELAKQALEFMESVIRKKMKSEE